MRASGVLNFGFQQEGHELPGLFVFSSEVVIVWFGGSLNVFIMRLIYFFHLVWCRQVLPVVLSFPGEG